MLVKPRIIDFEYFLNFKPLKKKDGPALREKKYTFYIVLLNEHKLSRADLFHLNASWA